MVGWLRRSLVVSDLGGYLRQRHTKARALTECGFKRNRQRHEIAKPLDDRQSQAKPRLSPPVAIAEPHELPEDFLALVRWDSRPGVQDFDFERTGVTSTANEHAPLGGVAHRIGNKVQQDALQQNGVGAHPCTARNNAQDQPFRASCPRKGCSKSFEQPVDRKGDRVCRQDARIELGYVKQRIEKLVEYSQRRFHPLDHVLPFRRLKPGAQLRNEKAQGVQGLTQVVIRCGQKAGLRQVGEFELLGALDDLSLQIRIGFLELGGHEVELVP